MKVTLDITCSFQILRSILPKTKLCGDKIFIYIFDLFLRAVPPRFPLVRYDDPAYYTALFSKWRVMDSVLK